ncbi:Enterobactin exporter EntS [Sodalis praecaptivus]|nr:Enterobactin exporter EntS [Sodalis praecaptivus]
MARMTPSHEMVALIQVSMSLPIMLFAVLAGAISDVFNRRKVMLLAYTFIFVVSVCLVVMSSVGLLSPWSLLAFTLAMGVGAAMYSPAWLSSVHKLVPREDLTSAVGLNSMSYNLIRTVAPALGGLLIVIGGPAVTFAFNAACYLPLIWALIKWHPAASSQSSPDKNIASAIAAGIRYVALSPAIRNILFRCIVFGFGAAGVMALLPVVTRDVLHADATLYGVFLGAFGVGGILGGIVGPALRRLFVAETIAGGAFLIFGCGDAVIAILRSSAWVVLGLGLCGMAWVVVLSLFNVTVQLLSPRGIVGRVLSLYQTAVFGATALGNWFWGMISERTDPFLALWLGCGVLIAGAVFGRFVPMPKPTE